MKPKIRPKVKFKFKGKKVKFSFRKKPKYEIGWHYAWYNRRGDKLIGLFGKKSTITRTGVTLYVLDRDKQEFVPHTVQHQKIDTDPWSTVGCVPREAPPKCVLYVPQSRCERKYGRGGGQAKIKGMRIVKRSVM
jgi:hypothetical protein